MDLHEYGLMLGDARSMDIAHLDEPHVERDRCEKLDYVRLEDLCVGDVLYVRGDKESHPHAKYLIEIVEIKGKPGVRIWNGRGPYCFVGSLNAINYYEKYTRTDGKGELGSLKVGATSTWPYFIVHEDGLRPNELTWCDVVGEIFLQRHRKDK